MNTVVLSAASADHPSMAPLAGLLRAELTHAGYTDIEWFDLTATPLAFCQGEFDCWVKTPGLCRSHDAEMRIATAVHDADALVVLGPVAFGGHGHVVKRALDRLICLLAPFFTKRVSLTHHELRYPRHQSLFFVGWTHEPSPAVASTFADLNDANAINYLSPGCGAVVLDDGHADTWGAQVREMLASPCIPGVAITDREALRRELLAAAQPDAGAASDTATRRAALFVGSAKVKGTSASEALARAFAKRLASAGVAMELHFATEFVHENERSVKAAASIAACDLFALITPLYVDSLPALVTHALELVARARETRHPPARFTTLINCGFPEPEQTRTALAIARHFAMQASYAWAGGLPLGGGGVVAPDSTLDEAHGPVAHVVRALDLAVPALAAGGVVPDEAIAAMATAPMPDMVYRVIGDLGWRWEARKHGLAQRDLRARPFDDVDRRT